MPVVYAGVVPDPFREGREVIVSGELKQGTFVAERDSLVTKCPSKFTKDEQLVLSDGGRRLRLPRVGLLTAALRGAARRCTGRAYRRPPSG